MRRYQSVEKLVRKDPANDLKELLAWAEQAGQAPAYNPKDAAESLAKRRRREVGCHLPPPTLYVVTLGETCQLQRLTGAW
jgi:hypothetical protein